ncbi:hypothetical protein A9Q84_16385 [Halobacteriovorax marinus]|uniref:Porin domain-containing protein n=1 Tax=Halobacteriovorax marinus TaxID=97084 RepID=A0A1Y5F895_9BACT|nr:hypothetical protein A9Q84_16385 [Halobacteriovorax marinus]
MYKAKVNVMGMVLMVSTAAIAEIEIPFRPDDVTVKFTGKVSALIYNSGSQTSLIDNGSRAGVILERSITEDIDALFRGEWAFNITDSDSHDQFNDKHKISNNTPSGKPFKTRLGYISFRSKKFGTLSIGKQWSAYSDVTGFTDQFNVFGGEGSGTYNFNSDGGASGTGRAENSVIHRIDLGKVKIAVQAQFKEGEELVEDPIASGYSIKYQNGYGASVIYQPLKALRFGVAHNRANYDIQNASNLQFDSDKQVTTAISTSVSLGQFTFAYLYSINENHEVDNSGTIFDGRGQEIYAGYQASQRAKYYVGFNKLTPKDLAYHDAYEKQYYIVGASYNPHKKVTFYAEGKIDNSSYSDGSKADNAMGAGVTYTF